MNRRSIFRPLLALIAGLSLTACERAPAPDAGAAGAPPPVSVATAIARDVVLADEFPGRFEAVDAVAVRARVNGYLQSVHFRPGSEVAKGDLLFVIDPRPFQARLSEARAALATLEADLRLARIEKARQARMLDSRATSQREFDAASSRLQSLEAQRQASLAAI